jgi:hypothetical protein
LTLVEDEGLRQRLGRTGRSHVLQRFGYQRLVSDMSQLYNELLERKKK